jgi:hypothetical protein
MEKWFFDSVTNNFQIARDVMKMGRLAWIAKMDHIYTPIMDKVCVDLAIHTVTAINAPLMCVPLAQIAL